MSDYEHCIECEEHTGRAGANEDSLFHGYSGPFCEDCFESWPDNQVAEIMLLRARVSKFEASAVVPKGYKLVPIQPTRNMIDAAHESGYIDHYDAEITWEIMVAAAQEPLKQKQDPLN
jgi:hypothetical protein